MPFKSDLQRRYMNWSASKGKIQQSTVNEFNKASKGLDLPEEVTPKFKKLKDKLTRHLNKPMDPKTPGPSVNGKEFGNNSFKKMSGK